MNPADLRAAVPALEGTVYLNTGASGPSPRRVVEAAERTLERHEYESPGEEGMYPAGLDVLDETRAAVADHLGAPVEGVALTHSTTDGIGRLAAAIDWDPGDVVVRTDLEHAAGILPWRRLREAAGVEVRTLETTDGRIDRDEYREAVADARLVTFSSITWTHGTRLPVAELTDVAHDAGARVLVDAVQSPGQRPVVVGEWGADAVAAAGHKWLLNVWGAGFLFVDPDWVGSLTPAQLGYRGVEEPYQDGLSLRADARRFETGTVSPAPYAGLQEAIRVVDEVGYRTITDRIERLTDRLKAGLGDRLVSPEGYESGLVTFADDDPEATVERLAGQGIQLRDIPPMESVRASVHAFNTAEDVDALLDALDDRT